MSADSIHHDGMMCGGGGDELGGIGPGDKVFCLMRFLTSIDHGGRRLLTAAMKPHITNPDMDCIKLEIATFKFGE